VFVVPVLATTTISWEISWKFIQIFPEISVNFKHFLSVNCPDLKISHFLTYHQVYMLQNGTVWLLLSLLQWLLVKCYCNAGSMFPLIHSDSRLLSLIFPEIPTNIKP